MHGWVNWQVYGWVGLKGEVRIDKMGQHTGAVQLLEMKHPSRGEEVTKEKHEQGQSLWIRCAAGSLVAPRLPAGGASLG